ncbi:MAG TPA: DUF2085 domain-containing protein [Anaerolineales bacterium]|nr:DUF2085 domain-containing protein [Anaerolineales bacterium]
MNPYNSAYMQLLKECPALNSKALKSMVFISAGLLLLGWLLSTPPGLLGKADAIAYAVCHRIDLRSFHLGDRQLPLCARCTGMYLGAMLGLVYQWRLAPRRAGTPPKRVIAILALLLAAFGVDGLNSYFHLFPIGPTLYEPSNLLRLLTGTGMGIVIASALYPAFNQTMWRNRSREPALKGVSWLFLLLILAGLLDLLVLSGNPLILYPMALISAGGVIVLLSMVYSMVWVMIFRVENRFSYFYQLLLPLTGGFALSLIQIGLFDLGRFLLTGTWDGFHIG